MVRILVVDDFAPWREHVRSILQRQPQYKVVGEAADGFEGVEKSEILQPELILLDVGLPKLNGIEAAREIQERAPMSKVLFVTENRSRKVARDALRTNALGYLVKSDGASELLRAVQAVLQGKEFISKSLNGHQEVETDNKRKRLM